MLPEEKMAARVLARKQLEPPYDLIALAKSYGDLSFKRFPFNADGITVGIGSQSRPKIIINSNCPETRQRFTLAHEIGHVVIPWHTGTVISHLEPWNSDNDYFIMEQEANRFAAELLMPTNWLKQQYKDSASIHDYFRRVLQLSGASKDAVFYKIFKYLDTPVACARLNEVDETITSLAKSAYAPVALSQGSLAKDAYPDAEYDFEQFSIDDKLFCAWRFKGKEIIEDDPRSWREILEQMLSDCELEKSLGSINSIFANAFQRNKHLDDEGICGAAIRSFSSRDNLPGFKEHYLFDQYIVKRVKELKARKK